MVSSVTSRITPQSYYFSRAGRRVSDNVLTTYKFCVTKWSIRVPISKRFRLGLRYQRLRPSIEFGVGSLVQDKKRGIIVELNKNKGLGLIKRSILGSTQKYFWVLLVRGETSDRNILCNQSVTNNYSIFFKNKVWNGSDYLQKKVYNHISFLRSYLGNFLFCL